MGRINQLHNLGQSLWYDNIQRRLIENGELDRLINLGEIKGITSNPSIFNNAISRSHDYDSALKPMSWSGWSAEQIFYQVAAEDIRAAADLFKPVYENTQKVDGYVSMEVSPYLAHDTQETIKEAQRIWNLVARPNLMVKIPATVEGIEAIKKSIAAGINVNVTLIFSLERYKKVMEAYISALEERVSAGLPVENIASVASFFVSRVDNKVDPKLQEIIDRGGKNATKASQLLGQAAIANARLAYELFCETFGTERFARLKSKGARVQRPLWASTSTKNPNYRDVLYVEELIGPDTVDTAPPHTIDAFRDHGNSALTLHTTSSESHKIVEELQEFGISMEKVTDELEVEGVKAFADSFSELLKTISDRRNSAIIELGALASTVPGVIQDLEEQQAARRLFDGDPSLWTSDSAGQNEIKNRLGWLRSPQKSLDLLPDLNVLLAEVASIGYTHVLLLGMGGSSLAPEVLSFTFGTREDGGTLGLNLSILDSTDPGQVRQSARLAPIERTMYIVSSKSGTTSEVKAFFDFFWSRAKRKLGERAGDHFIAITDPGTSLEKLALENKFCRVFLADHNVGGRYSALTAFGLVPAALLGLDVQRLLSRAQWMASQCSPEVPAGRNPGLVLGGIIGQAALQGRDKLTLIADPELSPFGAWAEQLIAESSGKQNKGIVPIDCEPPANARAYGNDRLFVYLRQSGSKDKFVASLRKASQPVLELDIANEYDFGAEFYRWEVAVAIACAVLKVNAFDQPDVQDSKTRTNQKIIEFQKSGSFQREEPIWSNAIAKVYGNTFLGIDKITSLPDVVLGFIHQARECDYIAINAYLPRNGKTISALQSLRGAILKKTSLATTLGFGPRFQHSTGQLHKGGANNGLFIQITTDHRRDITIPGEGITFATLETAQAIGDLEALQARDRRVISINLINADTKALTG